MQINPIFFLLIIPALLAWLAQARVRRVYDNNEGMINQHQISGLKAARQLLDTNKLQDVSIEVIPGRLTDHYDPTTKTLRLSKNIASSQSITVLGIVVHEVAHVFQVAEGYFLMRLRTSMALRINTFTQWSAFIFIGGILFRIPLLMALAGFFMFGLLVFTLVTLPVERNASIRALTILEEANLIKEDEKVPVKQ